MQRWGKVSAGLGAMKLVSSLNLAIPSIRDKEYLRLRQTEMKKWQRQGHSEGKKDWVRRTPSLEPKVGRENGK